MSFGHLLDPLRLHIDCCLVHWPRIRDLFLIGHVIPGCGSSHSFCFGGGLSGTALGLGSGSLFLGSSTLGLSGSGLLGSSTLGLSGSSLLCSSTFSLGLGARRFSLGPSLSLGFSPSRGGRGLAFRLSSLGRGLAICFSARFGSGLILGG